MTTTTTTLKSHGALISYMEAHVIFRVSPGSHYNPVESWSNEDDNDNDVEITWRVDESLL